MAIYLYCLHLFVIQQVSNVHGFTHHPTGAMVGHQNQSALEKNFLTVTCFIVECRCTLRSAPSHNTSCKTILMAYLNFTVLLLE